MNIEEKWAKDHPPRALIAHTGKYAVTDVSRWSPYVLGTANCQQRWIKTVESEEPQEKRNTVLHEMMHVASNCNGNEQLHRAIQQMTPKLLELLQKNPDITNWLIGATK